MTSSPRETELCHYHYDPLDRLISHALADAPGRQRFYCKSRLTTEIQGAMRYSIVQQGDQLLAQQRSEGDASDTTLLATDQQRSVLQTVKANQLPQPIAYSPYGHRSTESGLLSLLGFNGERPDPVTGCYLLGNGYRACNPVLMRFNSPDSWSPFEKGGLNSYIYCSGDPANHTDSTGHSKFRKLWSRLFGSRPANSTAPGAGIVSAAPKVSSSRPPNLGTTNTASASNTLKNPQTLSRESSNELKAATPHSNKQNQSNPIAGSENNKPLFRNPPPSENSRLNIENFLRDISEQKTLAAQSNDARVAARYREMNLLINSPRTITATTSVPDLRSSARVPDVTREGRRLRSGSTQN